MQGDAHRSGESRRVLVLDLRSMAPAFLQQQKVEFRAGMDRLEKRSVVGHRLEDFFQHIAFPRCSSFRMGKDVLLRCKPMKSMEYPAVARDTGR